MKIYKYQLEIDDHQTVLIPCYYKLLHVETQNNTLCLWAIVDPEAETTLVKIRIVGTGHDFDPAGLNYIGSAKMHNGMLVWHVFEDKS